MKQCPVCRRKYATNILMCPEDYSALIIEEADPFIGTLLNESYLVEEELGRGGMSVVYKARDTRMDRLVAIKMLQVLDGTSIKRFQQEAQAASCLRHPNVIQVFDYGVVPSGQPYLVMDFLAGSSLTEIIRKENHVDSRRVLQIFAQACDALEHAHQKGIIHRDLKSGNIMLIKGSNDQDEVRVLDFGIAKLMPSSGKEGLKLTATGEVFGSPIYMSPEQCMGQPLDIRSDIYSMGAVMYEALTGRPPLMGKNITETMKMHVLTMPPNPSELRPELAITKSIDSLVMRALQKAPEKRYQSMKDFKDALEHMSKQLSKEDRPLEEAPVDKKTKPSARSQSSNQHEPEMETTAAGKSAHVGDNSKKSDDASSNKRTAFLAIAGLTAALVIALVVSYFSSSH